jgi:ABC-type oligopeptide transport system substrate-binding subunit
MTAPHRSTVALLVALLACAFGALGQPPDEVEDPNGGVKKRLKVEDAPGDIKGPDAGPGSAPDDRLDELQRAGDAAAHPALKELYLRHAVPFDRMYTKSGVQRIKPIPVARGERMPAQFGVQELERDRFGAPQGVNTAEVRKFEFFEEVAVLEANAVLASKPYGTGANAPGWLAADQLAAAELLLSAALRFHDYARENPRDRPIRRGRGWDTVRKPLAERLREVRLAQLKYAVASGEWVRAREYGSRLMVAYPRDAAVAADVAGARVLESKRLLASDNHFDHVKARELLDEFEARYPGGGGEPVRALRAQLADIAQKALTRAKDKIGAGDLTTARGALAQAAALDPGLAGLRDLQRELKAGYQTLYVGVRDFPVTMSPVLARLDSEKQAAELLFEGLLEEVPDDGNGTRYRPGTAVQMPGVVPNGREFLLRAQERDATGRYGFESHDVVGTLKLLQARPETWAAYALPWFDELPTPRDNNALRVALKQGHPDPRALLTFKLLPARWMLDNGTRADDLGFAEKPTGTGPYRLGPVVKREGAPRELVFTDNPLYGRWRDRSGQPFIKEIRFVDFAKINNPVEAFKQGSLHVLTDVPTADLDKFMGPAAGLSTKVQAFTATTNRRVYMLAVNHRRPQMQSKLLRQGIHLALDREKVLNEVYRAGKPEFHRALGGPFPPLAWATTKGTGGAPVPVVNKDLADQKLRAYIGEPSAKSEVTLSYPEGDPLAFLACTKIKEQVELVLKDAPRQLKVALEPVPARDLLLRVEDEHRFDLAYLPFDYPDDWYPFALGAMLDPAAAERGGRNWFGFLAKNTGADDKDAQLGQLLTELRAFRDFGSLSAKTLEAHKLFNECVPFVPLWQLDRHALFSNAVKVHTDDSGVPVSPRVLDATRLFQGVANWRLDG